MKGGPSTADASAKRGSGGSDRCALLYTTCDKTDQINDVRLCSQLRLNNNVLDPFGRLCGLASIPLLLSLISSNLYLRSAIKQLYVRTSASPNGRHRLGLPASALTARSSLLRIALRFVGTSMSITSALSFPSGGARARPEPRNKPSNPGHLYECGHGCYFLTHNSNNNRHRAF